MYPMLKEGVTIGTLCSEGSEIAGYYIENKKGEEHLISHALFQTFLEADGTRPLIVPEEDQDMFEYLDRQGFLQRSRFVKGNGLFNRFIVFSVGSGIGRIRKTARVMNSMLPFASVILFVAGVLLVRIIGAISSSVISGGGLYSLLVFSILLHEVCHMIAGISYDFKICNVGVLLLGMIPCGAYIAYEEKDRSSLLEKIQFALAGVEGNLLAAGLCLIGAVITGSRVGTLVAVANVNVALVVFNLIPAMGLDGEAALSALFGVNSITRAARNWLASGKRTHRLLRSGLPGAVCLCCFIIVLTARFLFWLLLGLNLLNIVLYLFNQIG